MQNIIVETLNKTKSKDILRKEISQLKKKYTPFDLQQKSEEVFSVLEITGAFAEAQNIFIYHSLSDEVSTGRFIDKWKSSKNFYVPVVTGDELVFRPCAPDEDCNISSMGIKEPRGADFTGLSLIDMIIVPGVAFDRKMNRMGRGKGYYDRFLPKLKAIKVGVCFDFQLLDSLPYNDHDVKMDMIVSENDLIW